MEPGDKHECTRHAPGCDGWRDHDCGDSTCGQERERCPGCMSRWPVEFEFGGMSHALTIQEAESLVSRLLRSINAAKGVRRG